MKYGIRKHRARELTYASLAEDEERCKANGDIWVRGYRNNRTGAWIEGYCRRR